MPPKKAAFYRKGYILLAFLVFALLVSNTATCFASRLAGCLAFAATAVLCAFAKITSFDGFDVFHDGTSTNNALFIHCIISRFFYKVNNIIPYCWSAKVKKFRFLLGKKGGWLICTITLKKTFCFF